MQIIVIKMDSTRIGAIKGCSYAKRDISPFMVLYLYQKKKIELHNNIMCHYKQN